MGDETGATGKAGPGVGPGTGDDTGAGTTSKSSYTAEELKAALEKAVNDALSEAGRKTKAAESRATAAETKVSSLKSELDSVSRRLAEAEREREEAALRAAEGDPDLTAILQDKSSLKAERAALAKKTKELEAKEAEIAENQRTVLCFRLAGKSYPDNPKAAAAMADALGELGISDEATLEKIAKGWRATGTPGGAKREHEEHPRPDSALTTGTVGALSKEEAESLDVEAYAARRRKMPDMQ